MDLLDNYFGFELFINFIQYPCYYLTRQTLQSELLQEPTADFHQCNHLFLHHLLNPFDYRHPRQNHLLNYHIN